jgi:hypothetical protein
VTRQRFSFGLHRFTATMILAAVVLLPATGCLSDLIPGHKEAMFKKQVEADSFPRADQAQVQPSGNGNNRHED